MTITRDATTLLSSKKDHRLLKSRDKTLIEEAAEVKEVAGNAEEAPNAEEGG
jgi:hypothetical protein